jgi:hypothetical protein
MGRGQYAHATIFRAGRRPFGQGSRLDYLILCAVAAIRRIAFDTALADIEVFSLAVRQSSTAVPR